MNSAGDKPVGDELHLAQEVDECRWQQQGVVTKSCSQDGELPASFSPRNIPVLLHQALI